MATFAHGHNCTVGSDKLLHIYLNDHLAGSSAGIELAKRCLSNNRDSPLGTYLEAFIREGDEDRQTLMDLMNRVGARKDPVKQLAGVFAERLGRLKLNGQLLGYSDLSRLVELEGLCTGVEGKLSMWRALRLLDDPRLHPFDVDGLAKRATAQRRRLERFRTDAALVAFRPGPVPVT